MRFPPFECLPAVHEIIIYAKPFSVTLELPALFLLWAVTDHNRDRVVTLPYSSTMVFQSIIARFGIAFAILAAGARGDVVDITGEVRLNTKSKSS